MSTSNYGMPYRTPSDLPPPGPRPNFLIRAWRAVFGRLIYDGEETCGHCRYWKPVMERKVVGEKYSSILLMRVDEYRKVPYEKGDCILIYSADGRDKRPEEKCHRFTARRKYKRRVR